MSQINNIHILIIFIQDDPVINDLLLTKKIKTLKIHSRALNIKIVQVILKNNICRAGVKACRMPLPLRPRTER